MSTVMQRCRHIFQISLHLVHRVILVFLTESADKIYLVYVHELLKTKNLGKLFYLMRRTELLVYCSLTSVTKMHSL